MIKRLIAITVLLGWMAAANAAGKIPVIFDTDIGFDIDDTWALGMLVKRPELDVKLVLGSHGKNLYRAGLLAKFLETVERSDIPVGIGPPDSRPNRGAQSSWLGDYNVNDYPGTVYQDGVQAMIDIIMASDEPITIVTVGPLNNLAEALRREPRIAGKARVIANMGSIYKGMNDSPHPIKEYNASANIKASQQVLAAAWPVTITPLDTAGSIKLNADDYRKVRKSGHVVAEAVIDNYRAWLPASAKHLADRDSTLLFDAPAVYLATLREGDKDEFLSMEILPVAVTGHGMTVIDPNSRPIQVAMAWKDKNEFQRYIRDTIARKQGMFGGGIFGLGN
jgi:inosine-uridine nucleoside N-ribohydrolase